MACLIRHKICVAAGARVPKGFDWTEFCARIWQKGEIYLATNRVRPTQPNGYEFEAGANGQSSGKKEPKWALPPAATGATPQDGSLLWTRQPISAASLIKTINTSNWTATAPLVVDGATTINANGELKTQAFINANGVPAGKYEVRNEIVFSDGHEDYGLFEVEVE